MKFEDYLKEHQKILYNTFLHARLNHRESQAYLIKGDVGTPTLECAKFLAKSLICDSNKPFACNECAACKRFDEGNYSDFILLNAQKDSLKVADIDELRNKFASSSLESKAKMIYIIHHVENMNRESINALLKFLEEPGENIFAFLTTENESKVLETILSRCQHLKLLPNDKNIMINDVINLGIDKEDAYLLANFAKEENTLINMSKDETYLFIKDIFKNYIISLSDSLLEGYYYLQKVAIVNIKTKEQIRLFIDMLAFFFKELMYKKINIKTESNIMLDYQDAIIKQVDNLENIYKEIMFTRGRIELNVTISLIIEHLGFIISQGGKQNGSTNC